MQTSFVLRLHEVLERRGIQCWLDEKQLVPGDDIYEQVDSGIRLYYYPSIFFARRDDFMPLKS